MSEEKYLCKPLYWLIFLLLLLLDNTCFIHPHIVIFQGFQVLQGLLVPIEDYSQVIGPVVDVDLL